MDNKISLRKYENERMIIAGTPRLILELVRKANTIGRLKGEVEDVLLVKLEDGTFNYEVVVKGSKNN